MCKESEICSSNEKLPTSPPRVKQLFIHKFLIHASTAVVSKVLQYGALVSSLLRVEKNTYPKVLRNDASASSALSSKEKHTSLEASVTRGLAYLLALTFAMQSSVALMLGEQPALCSRCVDPEKDIFNSLKPRFDPPSYESPLL